jgi:hypothetical protein
MKKLLAFGLTSFLVIEALGLAAAQEKSEGMHGPPKVLAVFREFVKPGKGGSTHEKAESAFVQAYARAKWATHYLAAESTSGKPRVLFLTGYDSFEAWEKDINAQQKNPALSAALERAQAADGELLSDADAGALNYRDDYSLRAASVDIPHMRYFEISLFHVRPGHEKEWDSLVKLVMATYEKIPDTHWATYEAVYGQDGGTFIVFNPMKSASEIDRGFAQSKEFMTALGEDGMKKLSELSAESISSSQTNLFAFNPRMSYVSDEWIKADPDFWKPKAAGAAGAAKKPAEKPAANQ